jgi:hypothetical protein
MAELHKQRAEGSQGGCDPAGVLGPETAGSQVQSWDNQSPYQRQDDHCNKMHLGALGEKQRRKAAR